MSLLSSKAMFAIAAVVDVALHRGQLISAQELAADLKLPTRYLEPVLQALVHEGVFKGVRGPHGGYDLARTSETITLRDIVECVDQTEKHDMPALSTSRLLKVVVAPTIAVAELNFLKALGRTRSLVHLTSRIKWLCHAGWSYDPSRVRSGTALSVPVAPINKLSSAITGLC